MYSFCVWIVTVLLSAEAETVHSATQSWAGTTYVLNVVGLVLAGTTVGISIRSLFDLSS